MALKGSRYELYTDIQWFMNEVAQRGGIASLSTVGSGAALDQSQALVTYASNSSGVIPWGILLNDMVNYDLTRQHINWHKDEVQQGGKVTLGRRGWWTTNFINGTPAKGDYAALASSGYVNVVTAANYQNNSYSKAINPVVGQFQSTLDEDGYAEIGIALG
jgi:hypothetical protein